MKKEHYYHVKEKFNVSGALLSEVALDCININDLSVRHSMKFGYVIDSRKVFGYLYICSCDNEAQKILQYIKDTEILFV